MCIVEWGGKGKWTGAKSSRASVQTWGCGGSVKRCWEIFVLRGTGCTKQRCKTLQVSYSTSWALPRLTPMWSTNTENEKAQQPKKGDAKQSRAAKSSSKRTTPGRWTLEVRVCPFLQIDDFAKQTHTVKSLSKRTPPGWWTLEVRVCFFYTDNFAKYTCTVKSPSKKTPPGPWTVEVCFFTDR